MTQLTLIISLVVAIIIVYQLGIAAPLTSENISYTSATTNSTLTDNVDGWIGDNGVNDGETSHWGVWDSDLGVLIIASENAETVDNAGWYQFLTIASIYDGVDSATLTFDYNLVENTQLVSCTVYGILDDGTDNNVIYSASADNKLVGSQTVENDVTSYITAAGTYAIWMQAEIEGTDTSDNIRIQFDNASLTVNIHDDYVDPDAQAAYDRVFVLSWAGIGLMAVAIIILAASVILGIVRGFGGGGRV